MRFALFLTCAIAAAQTPPPKGTIEGCVVSLAGAPLRKSELTLTPQTPSKPGQAAIPFVASTGADGKFAFADLPPDEYFLSVKRVGYVDHYYHEKSLKLESGQKITDVEIHLTPQGMIIGKTIDEDGDPVPGLSVNLQRWTYTNGARRLVGAGWASSQANGSFVFGNLAAGTYLINASYPSQSAQITASADRSARETNLPTFYPNALDPRGAVPVPVAAGAEIRGIEIRMRRGRTFDIRGRLESPVDFPYSVAVGFGLWLKTDDVSSAIPRFGFVAPKTLEFQFKNLIPGTYVMRAVIGKELLEFMGGKGKGLVGQIEATITDGNLDNVVVPLSEGIELTGTIKTEGDNPAPLPHPGVWLDLVNRVIAYSAETIDTGEDGVFHARGLLPEVYRVAFGAPDGYYMKQLRLNGQELAGTNLDLRRGDGGDLQILLSPNAAEVSGVVRDTDGNAVSAATVQVFDGTRMAGAVSVDRQGAFRIGNLAPGSYKIFAWEDTSSGVTQAPEFRRAFEPVDVKLVEKSRETVDLKLVVKSAIDAEAVKIQ